MSLGIFSSVRFHAALASVVLVLILLFMLLGEAQNVSLLFLIFLFGGLGGLITTYLRLRAMGTEEAEIRNKRANLVAILQVYFTPVTAGVFGVVMYGLCLSGLLGGELFPAFTELDAPFESVNQMFETVRPAGQVDAAKAMMWGFIAGFAEKLVPNILDRLGQEAEQ